VRYLLADGVPRRPIDFRPTVMSVSINLDTAKLLGLTVSPAMRRRFDYRFSALQPNNTGDVPLAEGAVGK
jgi:hypothetical protein